jgi:hypothetical protein
LVVLIAGIGSAMAQSGTIKVDGTPIDSIPENTSHNSCQFTVEFRGFDHDDLVGTVTFDLLPPTGSGTLLTDSFSLTPSNLGATELDGSKTYTLTFPSDVKPEPQLGFHVRLTANGEEVPLVKTKVFWVQCEDPSTGPPTRIPVGTFGMLGLAVLLGGALAAEQRRSRALSRGMQAQAARTTAPGSGSWPAPPGQA